MIHGRKIKFIGTIAAGLTAGMIFSPMAAQAAVAAPSASSTQSAAALAAFRDQLVKAGAADDLKRFDALTAEQRDELAGYFLGDASRYNAADFKWSTTRSSLAAPAGAAIAQPMAATTTYSVWATSAFLFAGVTITKTKVAGTYTASAGSATKVNAYACTVVTNYDPLASVSTAKNAGYISGGKAYLQCKVTVKRGLPTPWGTVSWSTREAIQYLRANGSGAVEASGWQ